MPLSRPNARAAVAGVMPSAAAPAHVVHGDGSGGHAAHPVGNGELPHRCGAERLAPAVGEQRPGGRGRRRFAGNDAGAVGLLADVRGVVAQHQIQQRHAQHQHDAAADQPRAAPVGPQEQVGKERHQHQAADRAAGGQQAHRRPALAPEPAHHHRARRPAGQPCRRQRHHQAIDHDQVQHTARGGHQQHRCAEQQRRHGDHDTPADAVDQPAHQDLAGAIDEPAHRRGQRNGGHADPELGLPGLDKDAEPLPHADAQEHGEEQRARHVPAVERPGVVRRRRCRRGGAGRPLAPHVVRAGVKCCAATAAGSAVRRRACRRFRAPPPGRRKECSECR